MYIHIYINLFHINLFIFAFLFFLFSLYDYFLILFSAPSFSLFPPLSSSFLSILFSLSLSLSPSLPLTLLSLSLCPPHSPSLPSFSLCPPHSPSLSSLSLSLYPPPPHGPVTSWANPLSPPRSVPRGQSTHVLISASSIRSLCPQMVGVTSGLPRSPSRSPVLFSLEHFGYNRECGSLCICPHISVISSLVSSH